MPRLRDISPAGLAKVAVTEDQLEALRQQCRQKAKASLWFFARHCFGKDIIDNDLHREMCRTWEVRLADRRTLWLVPRMHLKSSLWTEAATLWELVRDPTLRFLIVSSRLDLAEKFLANIRQVIETNATFQFLFPEYCYQLAEESVRARCKIQRRRLDLPCSPWVGKGEGAINAGSSESSLTGFHYDRIHCDDIVDENNSTTAEMLQKVWQWFESLEPLTDSPKSIMRVVGTRWDYADVSGRIIDQENTRRLAALEQGTVYTPEWKMFTLSCWRTLRGVNVLDEQGRPVPLWPERFSYDDLMRVKSKLSSYFFSCQYLNSPVSPDDAVFKRDHIKRIDSVLVPDNVKNFIAVDLADEESIAGDFTVITVASFDARGTMYVREMLRSRRTPLLDLCKDIWRLTEKWRPVYVGVETAALQKSILRHYQHEAFKNGWNIPWLPLKRQNVSKRHRIMGLSPRVERGDFVVVNQIAQYQEIEDEMCYYPRAAHDDILDTLADLEQMAFKAPEDQPGEVHDNQFRAAVERLISGAGAAASNPDLSWGAA